MAMNKVNPSPPFAIPFNLFDVTTIARYMGSLINSLANIEQEQAAVINALVDNTVTPQGPVILKTYVKAALPVAATYINGMIIVSDDVGGLTPAFSDGTNWRRVADRAVIA